MNSDHKYETQLRHTHGQMQQLVDGHVVLQNGLLERQDALLCSIQLAIQISKLGLRAGCNCVAFLLLRQLVLQRQCSLLTTSIRC